MSNAFRQPWTAEETDACFIVRDVNGQLSFEDEPDVDQRGGNGRLLHCRYRLTT
jgi:hypothetical protein